MKFAPERFRGKIAPMTSTMSLAARICSRAASETRAIGQTLIRCCVTKLQRYHVKRKPELRDLISSEGACRLSLIRHDLNRAVVIETNQVVVLLVCHFHPAQSMFLRP